MTPFGFAAFPQISAKSKSAEYLGEDEMEL